MIFYSAFALLAGFTLDLLIGDPQGWPHLARLFGKIIKLLEKILYQKKNKRTGGTILALVMMTTAYVIPFTLLCFFL